MKAELNIITQACEKDFRSPDGYHNSPTGDWALWRELAGRGHSLMPHSLSHANHAKVPFAEAKQQVDLSLGAFEENMPGFERGKAVYCFPYNRSTPEVEEYVAGKVRAYRTGGGAINPWPERGTKRITTTGFGPENCEAHLDGCLNDLLSREKAWLVYNLHGLDEEGWGPVSADYLGRLLARLGKIDSVEVLPSAAALAKYG